MKNWKKWKSGCLPFIPEREKTGFTLDIAPLSAPRYIKFCVKGVGANLTATLAPK